MKKRNVLAMVRQYGVFTMFVTLSAAETHWHELLKILKKTVDKQDDFYTTELDFEEKARLIRSDPVTCALYFQYRFKQILETWKSEHGPFGKYRLQYMYHKIDFQHRESPHVHMLLWLKDSPKFNHSNAETFEEVTKFVDEIITTLSDDIEVQHLVK